MNEKDDKNFKKCKIMHHRKISRNNIYDIIKSIICRLTRRYEVKRILISIYEKTRNVLKTFFEKVIRDVVTYIEHVKRKTIISLNVIYALNRQERESSFIF